MKIKIGQGIDIHNIKKTNSIQKMGGEQFNLGYKIEAHSDGDIILHAISSALSGALGENDIGYYFSDKDKKNKGLDSKNILNFFLEKMKEKNYKISNIDITIISNEIMINPIKEILIKSLKKLIGIDDISIKGTRFEKITQENKQIHCYAILMIFNNN